MMKCTGMPNLALYAALQKVGLRSYRAKIMAVAFVGTHVPLIALAAYVALQTSPDWTVFAWTLGVAVAATLIGTGAVLTALHYLLYPLTLTSRALQAFRRDRTLMPLPRGFDDEAGTLMADAGETMTQLDRAMDALEHVDELTSLPNRRRMLDLIEARVRAGDPFAVAVIRFANHDRIADTLDLARGQDATVSMAARLRDMINPNGARTDAVLGALSGSEFALVLPGIGDAREVTETLLRILHETGREMALLDMVVRPVLASGAALFPSDAGNGPNLLEYAAAAAAQSDQAAPVVLHSPEARSLARDRYRMEQDLGTAVARGELELYYQPVVDLAAGRVVGAEALVRWHHPERGTVLPGAFIPVAEASGLIDEIGAWILHDACRQLGAWQAAGRDLRVAVNLSARQIADPHLYQRIRDEIRASAIDASHLEIELTETAAMVDRGLSRTVFGALRDLGLGIAIDDFGTGYASLSTLQSLPFTKLKIDREFVTRVHETSPSQAICQALIALARGLDLHIVAEGAESVEDVRYLHERGCALFQGFHFAEAMPPAAFEAAVDRLDFDLSSGAVSATKESGRA